MPAMRRLLRVLIVSYHNQPTTAPLSECCLELDRSDPGKRQLDCTPTAHVHVPNGRNEDRNEGVMREDEGCLILPSSL